MRIIGATRKIHTAENKEPAPWVHGGYSVKSNSGVIKAGDVLVVDCSIKYEPKSDGEIAAFDQYKDRISSEIDSGKLLKDLVAKLQATSWGDVPNPQGTRVQVRLPEGVTPPNAIDSRRVLGLPSWVKGEIQFKTEPFKQPTGSQQELFEQLSPPKSPNDSVRADQ